MCKYFLPLYSLSFHSLNIFWKAHIFNLIKFISLMCCFMNCAFCITYKNICLTQDHKDFLLFLSKSFIILGFYIQVYDSFWVNFCRQDTDWRPCACIWISNCANIICQMDYPFSSPNCLCAWLKFSCLYMHWLISGFFYPTDLFLCLYMSTILFWLL